MSVGKERGLARSAPSGEGHVLCRDSFCVFLARTCVRACTFCKTVCLGNVPGFIA